MSRAGTSPRTKEAQQKDLNKAPAKSFIPYTEEQLWDMKREEACETLNESQRRWCEVYVKSFNPHLAAIKAGYSKKSSHSIVNRLRRREDIRTYLAWLKLRAVDTLDIRPIDILEQYAKIGFADITDYVSLKNGRLTLMDSEQIDGQVVKSYKVGVQGTTIELYDKLSALKHLEQFFSEMPKSWQQRLEERKLEISEERLAMEQEAMGKLSDGVQEVGSALIQALKGVAEDVWTKDKEGDTQAEEEAEV